MMLVHLLIRLSALSMGLSYATCTTPQQQSQLAALHERLNQMISTLYSSPLLSKVKTTPSDEASTTQQESYSFSAAPAPQVVYLPPPTFLEAGSQPNDYGYPSTTHPVPRAAWPYDYIYQPQFVPPVYSPPLPRPYPDYTRAAYPQPPTTQGLPLPFSSPFTSSIPFVPFSSAQYSSPAPVPLPYQPGYSVTPTLAPYPPISPPLPMPYSPYYPPSLPYPPAVTSPYSSPIPHQYPPSLLSHSYPAPIPVPYPSVNLSPYSPSLSYPLFHHLASPAFPKPSDITPQPQYEYS